MFYTILTEFIYESVMPYLVKYFWDFLNLAPHLLSPNKVKKLCMIDWSWLMYELPGINPDYFGAIKLLPVCKRIMHSDILIENRFLYFVCLLFWVLGCLLSSSTLEIQTFSTVFEYTIIGVHRKLQYIFSTQILIMSWPWTLFEFNYLKIFQI